MWPKDARLAPIDPGGGQSARDGRLERPRPPTDVVEVEREEARSPLWNRRYGARTKRRRRQAGDRVKGRVGNPWELVCGPMAKEHKRYVERLH